VVAVALMDQVILGVGIAVGAFVTIWLGMIAFNLARDRSLQESVVMSSENLAMVLGAGFGLFVTGVLNFGMLIDVITQGIASHPFAITNLVSIGLGALGMEVGVIDTTAYVVATVSFVALALVITEVRG
jgi:hypothetical protein